MRRTGWFVAGVATAVGAVAAGAVARRRLRGEPGDELPPAVGFEQAMAPAAADEVMEVQTADVPVAAAPLPGTDQRAAELRVKIAESRKRLHAKARAGAQETEGGDPGSEPGPD